MADTCRVLDVGAWDGLFSFEAENRGATDVTAIDIYQKCAGQVNERLIANKPFQYAKKKLHSNVKFYFSSLEDWNSTLCYDCIFYFGVFWIEEMERNGIKIT